MADVTGQLEKKEKKNTIFDIVESKKDSIMQALPSHINSERFMRTILTTLRLNPSLQECSALSIIGASMVTAQLGLETGVLNQVYWIPYNNKNTGQKECQVQISYKGMIELLRRSGQLKDIYAYPVYDSDKFSITYGIRRDLIHEPNFENRGKVKGIYAIAILKDGTYAFEYMTIQEIREHEEKYRMGKFKNNIWVKNETEMGMKTVVKKLLKWLPISVELLDKTSKDEVVATYDDKTGEIKEEKIEQEPMIVSDFEEERKEIEQPKVVINEIDKELAKGLF